MVSSARRVFSGSLLAVAAALTLVSAAGLRAAAIPAAKVTGPIKATVALGDPSHDYPYSASVDDLKKYGYVEEEFFIEGTANRYTTPQGATGTVASSGHPWKSRIIVRRPPAGSFNGTAIIEWNNVTPGHDLDIDWLQAHDYWMRSGYLWVGVSAQRVGVEALKVWNATRYGSLDVTNGGAITNDDLSYDIFAQTAQAMKAGGAVVGGLRVQRLFATGHSQSAGRLGTYVNSVHPIAPLFDAVVLHGGGGKVRADLGTLKVWKLLSETDVLGGQAANRQPDTANYRSWEVAGDSHVDTQFTASSRKLTQRDGSPTAPGSNPGGARGGARGGAPNTTPTPTAASGSAARGGQAPAAANMGNASPCDRPPYSHVPFYHAMDAAFDHLQKWVKDGTLPPSAPPIETSEVGPPAVAARDAHGNALGGIRLAEHAAPTGVNTGQNSGPGFCRLYGSHTDFDATTLVSLYPTHDAYVKAVRGAVDQNLKAGYILKFEADATIAAADASKIGGK